MLTHSNNGGRAVNYNDFMRRYRIISGRPILYLPFMTRLLQVLTIKDKNQAKSEKEKARDSSTLYIIPGFKFKNLNSRFLNLSDVKDKEFMNAFQDHIGAKI